MKSAQIFFYTVHREKSIMIKFWHYNNIITDNLDNTLFILSVCTQVKLILLLLSHSKVAHCNHE